MLFYKGLEDIIFTRNQLFKCDELIILSGYLGPTPVERLKELPFHTTVIYGMYGAEGIQSSLHTSLLQKHKSIDNIHLLYSTMPVHSKCYVWKNKGEVVHALIGSANFSTNGLSTPFKEVLAETTVDTFDPLNEYLKMVTDKAISCEDAVVRKNKSRFGQPQQSATVNKDICSLPLYSVNKGTKYVPAASNLNWGFANANVTPGDACIRIGAENVRNYTTFFPAKQAENHSVEVLWDDGTLMTCLLEGSQPIKVDGVEAKYPKQISSFPSKKTMGQYLRKRLGVPEGQRVTMADLVKYGRDTVDVSLQGEGIYYFDFSVNKNG